jgi:hypothetical protein
MSRWNLVCGLFLLGVVLAVSQAQPPASLPVKPPPVKMNPSPIAALRVVVKEWPEIPADPKTTLAVVLGAIRERLRTDHQIDIAFKIDLRAFEAEGWSEEKMLDFSPVAERALAKEVNLSVAAYLQLILDRMTEKGPVPTGTTFLLRKGAIEITTNLSLQKQVWGGHPGPYLPLVHADFEKKPLDQALKDFAEQVHCNLVIDPRAGEKAKTPVTASLLNTPLDTAVTLLADMTGLQPVFQDNVIYVTTRENALLLARGTRVAFQLTPKLPPPLAPEPGVLILRVR